MRRLLTVLAILLALPLSVAACLWDRDTPASEAKGMPEVVAVLIGRFERNPALFHAMRLTRVIAQLQGHPEDLAAYDDAGVACDRLGRGDEAISWMEKKRVQLAKRDPSAPDVKEQRYRYHANLGTFLVHRCVRQGADRSKLELVKAARDEIARALEINPNAHFGREKYQLQAIDWIIDPPRAACLEELPNLLGWDANALPAPPDPRLADDAVRGLAGLIVLGNAWESVDVFHGLGVALENDTLGFARDRNGGRNTLAYFAWLRCRELIDAGRKSMLPDAPEGDALKAMLRRPGFVQGELLLNPAFMKLRADADAWHAARTAFMMKRLSAGIHPDTHPGFSDGYKEPPPPKLPTESVSEAFEARRAFQSRMAVLMMIGVPALAVGLAVGWSAVRAAMDRRRGTRAMNDSSEELTEHIRGN